MGTLDITMLVVYFAAVFAVGYWASRSSQDSSKSYFLSGRSVGWMAIGASLFASNISAEHFIGLAGSGASSGLAVGQFEWLACFILLLLGWFFVPFYLRLGVFTMPEFLERRYNRHCRRYLSGVSLLAYVFTKISVALYACAIVLETVMGLNIWVGAIALIVATGIYTLAGGLRAVIYTELFQAFVLIGGGIIVTVLAVSKVGGLGTLMDGVPDHFFNLWKSADHPDFPWTGILFGAPILGVWYWCTDQMIVQRTLAARSIDDAQRGTIFAGFLKLLPVFILVLPGIAGRILYPEVAADRIYAELVNNLLPAGVKGIVIAALLAALMSSLAAVYNSSSTLVVMDFYKPARPQASEKELVRAGQVATVALVVAGFAWLPFVAKMSEQLFVYLQSVQAYISPPIAAVFLIGLLWRRVNGTGALATLLVGFVLGAFRFIAEIGKKSDASWVQWEPLRFVAPLLKKSDASWAHGQPIMWYASINFLHVAVLLFVISVVVLVLVSLMTGPPTARNMQVFAGVSSVEIETTHRKGSALLNVTLSVALVVIVLVMWAYFSPWFFGAG